MSNPFFTLQNAAATRLALHSYLADVPMLTEEKGDVVNRLNQSLIKGGVKANSSGRAGCAMILHTPTGLGQGGSRSVSKMQIKLRIEIYFKVLINSATSGLQKEPLTVLWDVIQQMITWNSGAGQPPIELLAFDTLENTAQEIAYYADFSVPKTLTLTAGTSSSGGSGVYGNGGAIYGNNDPIFAQ